MLVRDSVHVRSDDIWTSQCDSQFILLLIDETYRDWEVDRRRDVHRFVVSLEPQDARPLSGVSGS